MQVALVHRAVRARPAPLLDAVRASEVSLGDDLERRNVQCLIGDDALEPAVLFFELFEPHQIARFEAAVLRSPRV
jgi:hypothetical protein